MKARLLHLLDNAPPSRRLKKAYRAYCASQNRLAAESAFYVSAPKTQGLQLAFEDKIIQQWFESFSNERLPETAYHYKTPCYLEPRHGHILSPSFQLTQSSSEYYNPPWGSTDEDAFYLLFHSLRHHRSCKKFDRVISLREAHEGNYWHFYDDNLSKLRLLDQLSIDKDIPVLVAPSLFGTKFFQEFIEQSSLKERAFVPHDTMVRADEVYTCAGTNYSAENFAYALALVKHDVSAWPDPQSRYYLTRKQNSGMHGDRIPSNEQELVEELSAIGYNALDTSGMTLDEQRELFAGCRSLIALHGAGLTNIIYRFGRPMNILEIISPRHVSNTYFWLASKMGFDYDAVAGIAEGDRSYCVDVASIIYKAKLMPVSIVLGM